jgi:drug/metabolite transporter (DMT)-like permease
LTNLHLFLACIVIWGSTWIAITFQLGRVAPEASVFYRFLLASFLLFGYCLARRLPLAYSLREHGWIALFGVLMFGVSYILVYFAEEHVVSGLVAVGYSASPLLGMLGMWAFFGTPMTRRVTAGSLLGIAGIALVFWPELGRRHPGDPMLGAIFTASAVIASTLGSMVAHRNQSAGLPLWQTMAWGMLYGALFALACTVAGGKQLAFDAAASYVLSLLYLTLFGSIVAFAAFLTLLQRIGAARSGYIGVMVPIVALLISATFESFRWHLLTWAGIAISVAGNVVILREKRG